MSMSAASTIQLSGCRYIGLREEGYIPERSKDGKRETRLLGEFSIPSIPSEKHKSQPMMAFPIEELIAELSFGMTLHPGDVILTGTPSGVGNAREPQLFLKQGDEVVVRGEGLGELRNVMAVRDLAGVSDVRPG